MLLRESGKVEGEAYDLSAVMDAAAQSGVPHGEALTGFAESAVVGSEEDLRKARDALADEVGAAALVDAAGIVANFERMVRIADATGIPLDKPVAVFSVDMREELGIDSFGAAGLTPRIGPVLRAVGRIAQPLLRPIMSLYTSRNRS